MYKISFWSKKCIDEDFRKRGELMGPLYSVVVWNNNVTFSFSSEWLNTVIVKNAYKKCLFLAMWSWIHVIMMRLLFEYSPGHVPTQKTRDVVNGRHVSTLDFDGIRNKHVGPVKTASD